MPAAMHRKLRKLAEIARCSPEWIALHEVGFCVAQAFDDKDLDCLICFVPYDTREQAAEAAERGNAFQKCPSNYKASKEADDDGKFYVTSYDERSNIIPFLAPEPCAEEADNHTHAS